MTYLIYLAIKLDGGMGIRPLFLLARNYVHFYAPTPTHLIFAAYSASFQVLYLIGGLI